MANEKERTAAANDYAVALGVRIKELRKRKLITITQLSKYTGMSVGYLSNVERGLTSPTVASLQAICRELGVPVADLLSDTTEQRDLIRAADAYSYERPDYAMAVHSFDFGVGSDVFDVIEIQAGCAKTDAEALHPYPETCYVVEGELTLTVEGEETVLRAGDAACVKANHRHTMRNDGEGLSRSVWFRMRHSAVTAML